MEDDPKNTENLFQGFGKKVDNFLDELKEANERLSKEFQVKFEELKVSAEKIKEDVKNEQKWKEVEVHLKKAGQELKDAFKNAFK